PKLPSDTELDRLVIKAMESRLDPTLQLRRLYGLVYCETRPVQVYVDGSALNNGREDARAGSGVYFGRDSRRNAAVRVPDNQTNNRAEAFSVLRALEACNPHQMLDVYSDSEYAINSLTTWAPGSGAVGWRIPNGDVFGDIAYLLRTRPAGVTLHKVKAHSGHDANDAADALAKRGA
ncbi:ribonuclease H-like domain-containing protein, partial [Ephemerocybe angulata]